MVQLKGADKFRARAPHTKTRKKCVRKLVWVLSVFVRVLSISLFRQCSLEMRHVSLHTASSIFTTNTSGQRIVLAVWSILRTRTVHSITVSAGIVGDCLAGPHVLLYLLTGNHYRDFLLHDLPKLQEHVPLAEHECGTCSRAVRDVLRNTCHDGRRGRGGPTAWPPRSTPYLNPLDSTCGGT
jgi:hypothetical protein